MVERVEEDSKEETKEIPLLNKINNEGDEIVFELSSLIASGWVKVPLLVSLRTFRRSMGYGYNSYSKYENKEYVPRLFWMHRDWTLVQIHKYLFSQYSSLL